VDFSPSLASPANGLIDMIKSLSDCPFDRCWLQANDPWGPFSGEDHWNCALVFTRSTGVRRRDDVGRDEWMALVEESVIDGPKRVRRHDGKAQLVGEGTKLRARNLRSRLGSVRQDTSVTSRTPTAIRLIAGRRE
jgi:hypothetical protein